MGKGDMVEQHRPDSLGILSHHPRGLRNRHAALGHDQHHRLHQQRETALRPGPGHGNPFDAGARAAVHTGNVGVHIALELEVVQVSPGARLTVVDRARLAGLRMGEAAPRREIQVNVEALEVLVEAHFDNFPRGAGEAQGDGKNVFLIHGLQDTSLQIPRHSDTSRRLVEPAGVLRAESSRRRAGGLPIPQITHTNSSGAI